jgi:hypothetical protein
MKKKALALFLRLILTFALAACGSSDAQNYIDELSEEVENLKGSLDIKDSRIAELEEERRKMFGLNKETEQLMLRDYFESIDHNGNSLTSNDVYIYRYYGVFDSVIVVMFALNGVTLPPAIDEISVAGFTFFFNAGRHAVVWHSESIYSLQDAYDNGFLTADNLEQIDNLHKLYGV